MIIKCVWSNKRYLHNLPLKQYIIAINRLTLNISLFCEQSALVYTTIQKFKVGMILIIIIYIYF